MMTTKSGFHEVLPFFFFFFLLAPLLLPLISTAQSIDPCLRSCGSAAVPYPFGFSAACPIPLNCSAAGTIHLDGSGFLVRNVTSDALLIDVPPLCDRSLSLATADFFAGNYAPTWRSRLLLSNCTTAVSGCVVPTAVLTQQFDLRACGGGGANVSRCFLNGNSDSESFLTPENITATGCQYLFTSFGYEADSSALPALLFRTVELGWWVEGANCSCSRNARCTKVRNPVGGSPGFRCRCDEGFEGDGFSAGGGCRKVSRPRCNPSKYMSGSCGGTTRVGVLIGGIAAGATTMALLGLLFCLIRRRSSSKRSRKSTRRLLSQASCTVPLYPYNDIEKATNCFADSQRLGTGAYGTVYSGKLNNDKLVAIKKIKHRDTDGIEQVMNEIKLLSSVSHPNLVRLLGCCIERGEQILVYEFMPNGTLLQHLQRERGPALPWTVRLTIAAETAKAIAYLHSAIHPPIYHRDIKSSNILLDHNFNSKVADFGLSRIGMMESSHISTAPQGTPGYLDPQYHQNFHLSDKSDVYSFGVVLIEIITALKVVDFNRVQTEVNLAALAIEKIGKGCVDEIIDPCLEPNRDAWTLSSIHKVAELAFRCLAFHRDMRPSMIEVAEELEQIRLSGWVISDDNLFMSPALSLSSSTSNCTDKSWDASKSRRLIRADTSITVEEVKVKSPVSVVQEDPWMSEQSSPSTNSLLSNVIQ